ncbi:hypothetical protein ACGFX4_35815 [Kitasatospora sp. NPDC048365]|uniref:hypothetical protein n=1 Tax=Kitasatospora sp. NPDC048365 TaxID=3364050 RepID=UPI00371EF0E8
MNTTTAVNGTTAAGLIAAESVALNPTAVLRDGQVRYRVAAPDRTRSLAVTATATVRTLVAFSALGPADRDRLTAALARRLGPDRAEAAVTAGLGSGLLLGHPADAHPGADPAPARRHVLDAPPEGYAEAFADLAALLPLLGLLDRGHDIRALLTVAFTDRHGNGGTASLVDCAADLLTVVHRRSGMLDTDGAEEFGPADGSLAALLAARATADLAARLSGAAPGPVPELPTRFREPDGGYQLLTAPQDGSLLLLGAGTAGEPADPAPYRWYEARLSHRPDTDTLTVTDQDGRPLTVPCPPARPAWQLPAPIQIAAWLSGATRLRIDLPAQRPERPRLGRILLGPAVPTAEPWLIDCGGRPR